MEKQNSTDAPPHPSRWIKINGGTSSRFPEPNVSAPSRNDRCQSREHKYQSSSNDGYCCGKLTRTVTKPVELLHPSSIPRLIR